MILWAFDTVIDLSIVILNYNTRELLRGCLESLSVVVSPGRIFTGKKRSGRNALQGKSSRPGSSNSEGLGIGTNGGETDSGRSGGEQVVYEVFVVDNASTDGSAEMVRKEFPWVKLIQSPANVGFSAGNNLAVPQTRGRYVLFLNPDTIVPEETLPEMVRFMDARPEAGAATCYIELANGEMDLNCHRGFPTPWAAFCHFTKLENLFPKSRFFSRYHQGWKDISSTHEIDACEGSFIIVRRDAAEAVRVPSCGQGFWDEDFFFYGEDLDFCYRLKEGGWKIFYHPEVRIIHYAGAASGMKKSSKEITTATKESRTRVLKASVEAMRIFYKKHYAKKYPCILTWSVLFGIWILSQLRLLRHRIRG